MSVAVVENTHPQNVITDAVSNLIRQVTEDPRNGQLTFKATSQLQDGLRAVVTVRDFTFIADEPVSLGGTDEGPNPVEIVLGALAACQEIVIAAYAAVLGINVKRVRVQVKGHLDLRGFLNLDDTVRPGFTEIEYVTTIESDETDRVKQDQLIYFATNKCPVLDILQHPVPVKGKVQFSQ